MTQLLEATRLSKSYGANTVLQDVSLSVAKGEVVSIIGENGAGKSTLGKILAGITPPDDGSITLRGSQVSFSAPGDAIAAGIGIVHQELCLVDTLSIAENISLGREPTRWGLVDQRAITTTASRALERLEARLDPSRRVGSLTTAEKQLVEIARALSYESEILIFDEPTSSLSDHEGEILLSTIARLRRSGISIVYISHRLNEVQKISDRVVALRDGRNSGSLSAPHFEHEKLISLIVGRELRDLYGYRPRPRGPATVSLKNFRATSWHAPCSLTVHAGEIVGIAGLIGSGRTELLEAMYGARTSASGSIELQGAPAILDSPSAARKTGVSLVPESRKEQGIIPSFSISDTIALGSLDGGILTSKRSLESESKHAENFIRSLSVRCRGPLQPIGELSGGNQQKVVIAKSLSTRPRLLLLDEPTRGVDVGARREIYSILFDLAERGMAILFVSSEMEEVMGIADRILVMSEGAIMGELTRSQFSEHAIMSMASPHSRDAA